MAIFPRRYCRLICIPTPIPIPIPISISISIPIPILLQVPSLTTPCILTLTRRRLLNGACQWYLVMDMVMEIEMVANSDFVKV